MTDNPQRGLFFPGRSLWWRLARETKRTRSFFASRWRILDASTELALLAQSLQGMDISLLTLEERHVLAESFLNRILATPSIACRNERAEHRW